MGAQKRPGARGLARRGEPCVRPLHPWQWSERANTRFAPTSQLDHTFIAGFLREQVEIAQNRAGDEQVLTAAADELVGDVIVEDRNIGDEPGAAGADAA